MAFALSSDAKPQPAERARLEKYITEQKAILDKEPDSLAHVVPGAAPGADRLTTAAWTGVASILLNLDEFITRE